ncbi:MAG: glutamate-cysteine ligase family protein [Paludibaculum sp.]
MGPPARIRYFPTLEFRICDLPMRLDETLAIAALIQATVVKLCKLHSNNQSFRLYRRMLLMENKWRAARYGIDGKLIDFGKRVEVSVRESHVRVSSTWWTTWLDELGSRGRDQLPSSDPGKKAPEPIASCASSTRTRRLQEQWSTT